MENREEYERCKNNQERLRTEIRNQISAEHCLGGYQNLSYSGRELVDFVAKLRLDELNKRGGKI
ncbi:MAG: hypothetical protein AABX11_05125 [Nanoarchaeota archaeon]